MAMHLRAVTTSIIAISAFIVKQAQETGHAVISAIMICGHGAKSKKESVPVPISAIGISDIIANPGKAMGYAVISVTMISNSSAWPTRKNRFSFIPKKIEYLKSTFPKCAFLHFNP